MPFESDVLCALALENPSFSQPSRLDRNAAHAEPALAVLNKQGIVRFSNPAMARLFGCSHEDLDGREVGTLLPGLPIRKRTPGYNLAFAEFCGRQAGGLDIVGCSPTGMSIPVKVALRKVRIDRNDLILLGLHVASMPAEPDGALDRLMAASMSRNEAIMITDTAGIIQFVNPAFERATGYGRLEAIGQPASLIKSGLHDAVFYNRIWSAMHAGEEVQAVFINRRKNGTIFHESKHIRPFVDSTGITTHFVATSRSLSEPIRTALSRLQHEAYHDPLTQLPNRTLFRDRLRQALSQAPRRGERFALVFVDLDRFKEINDTHGHDAGDAVLRAAAASLSASVRNEDTVARLGGDEFVLILHDIHCREDIEVVSEKILQALAQAEGAESRGLPVRASIGASIFPDDGEHAETLLKHADLAMYAAKSGGGNRLHFFSPRSLPTHMQPKQVA